MKHFYPAVIDGVIRAVPADGTEIGFKRAVTDAFPNALHITDAWDAMNAERALMNDASKRAELDMYSHKAAAYVWGWLDAGGDRFNGAADSWAFSVAYGLLAARHLTEKTTHLPAIQDAFRQWCTDHTLGDTTRTVSGRMVTA